MAVAAAMVEPEPMKGSGIVPSPRGSRARTMMRMKCCGLRHGWLQPHDGWAHLKSCLGHGALDMVLQDRMAGDANVRAGNQSTKQNQANASRPRPGGKLKF